ncbi:MAG TPA: hypothetical protein PKH27_03130, partial [Candidatus Desulfobacillus denitrificans]|nr:hypothetical protein [Candidatus Desulfobacillus denitrificans]HNT63778.1 hypothetical protein [Candidatus Desulfobacillus denitrificans]
LPDRSGGRFYPHDFLKTQKTFRRKSTEKSILAVLPALTLWPPRSKVAGDAAPFAASNRSKGRPARRPSPAKPHESLRLSANSTTGAMLRFVKDCSLPG